MGEVMVVVTSFHAICMVDRLKVVHLVLVLVLVLFLVLFLVVWKSLKKCGKV